MAITKMDWAGTTIGTTEYSGPNNSTTLTPQTDDCYGWCAWDPSAMAAGDSFRFRGYEKLNGGTQRVMFETVLTGAQSSLLVFPMCVLTDGWDWTCVKLAGTDRTIPGSFRKLWTAGLADVNVINWAGSAVNALVSGRVDASVGAMAANVITAAATAVDFSTEVTDAILAKVYEGSDTIQTFLRLAAARLFGKATVPSGDGSYAYRDAADTKNRIAGSVTTGARTITTKDAT